MLIPSRHRKYAPARRRGARCPQEGSSIIEVLVTVVILAIGLLGLAGLQGQILFAELESYQRAQAVLLMNDMVDKMNANRSAAVTYVNPSTIGSGSTLVDCSSAAVGMAKDECEWGNALRGASEKKGTANVGGMVNALGCVTQIAAENATPGVCTPGVYLVTVVWQGVNLTSAPSVTCGQNLYGDDRYRRAISTRVSIGLPSCQ